MNRVDLRQYIDNAVGTGKSRRHDVFEKFRRNIDAAIRNAVVERSGRGASRCNRFSFGLVVTTGCRAMPAS